jgi:hypothetical protein
LAVSGGKTGMKKQIPILCLLLLFPTLPVSGVSPAVRITGKILTMGHVPFLKTIIQPKQSSAQYVLAGALLPELNRLQGATVEIDGRITGAEPIYPTQIVEVKNYTVRLIGEGENGKRPWVGVIGGADHLFVQTKTERLYLKGPLVATLAKYKGAKLWLTGTCQCAGLLIWRKAFLHPDAYGVIRPG